ncbi:MAG: hypothetical protein AMXMBFR19_02390 [Chthonomonadaceae bacterium]|uniref:Uncharacterized protein n=1 Tax=Candidatus Nitrosymbiomonas proteolyticus TaxID=2608984 RepID=A0A809RTE1_9BACT|nr:conserved hypothetical protein [Candidatus Nitrosymbiomonas proteolyticus]
MNPKLRIGILFLSGALLAAVIRLVLFANEPSDQALIKAALEDSLQASKEGRPGGVLELLSNQFSVNETLSPSHRDISRYVRDFRPDIEIVQWNPDVRSDSASVRSPAIVKFGFPVNQEVRISEVELGFEKESGVKWLLIPTKEWKLTSVTIPQEALQELVSNFPASQFGF